MRKVSWGVISTANIGVKKVIPGMQMSEFISVDAISSRSLESAQSAAAELNIPKAYGSYEALLADPDIEAIYNPLPNHLHVDWSIKCLEAGKHVLCEKPLGLDAKDAQRLVDAAANYPQLKVMEAFMYRFHPQWVQVKKWLDDNAIGKIKAINSIFTYYNDDPANVRNQVNIGGGGLLDIGCYNISISRYITNAEPIRVIGTIDRDPEMHVDRLVSGILQFGDIPSTFICSTQSYFQQGAQIIGENGRIEIDVPFNAPNDKPSLVHLCKNGEKETVATDAVDQYMLEGEVFSRAIVMDTAVPTPLSDAINNMKVIDAIFESGEKGGWVTL
ncbi:MAG: Gfo/Idh/MocA family oxidoreductase [Saprospiraceae bacterium]|nr:Gfo/Idh/MocA family oxidoreductase [Saprospiraceae bacterium]